MHYVTLNSKTIPYLHGDDTINIVPVHGNFKLGLTVATEAHKGYTKSVHFPLSVLPLLILP